MSKALGIIYGWAILVGLIVLLAGARFLINCGHYSTQGLLVISKIISPPFIISL